MLKKIKEKAKAKLSKAVSELVRIVDNHFGVARTKSTAPNTFVQSKSKVTSLTSKRKTKALKIPKQTSFKGSGYNGKGSVNTDATTFHNSRG